jgi:mono/diheme cytochrome c family protein
MLQSNQRSGKSRITRRPRKNALLSIAQTRDTVRFLSANPIFLATPRTRMSFPVAMMFLFLSAIPIIAEAQTGPVTGKEIFEQMCAGCHGTYGNGQEGTKSGFVPRIGTLANKEYMESVPDDYLKMIIKKGGAYMGKISAMPAWEHKFNDEQIDSLVAHIRTFTGTADKK